MRKKRADTQDITGTDKMESKYVKGPQLEKLMSLMEDFSYSDKILFGHQNAGHIGVTIETHDGSDSDCKELCGSQPAFVGVDTLSFLGYEGKMPELIKIVKNLHRQGCIVTLSAHMPNFSLGGDSFYDYSPNSTAGDCGKRIMPGGDLNAKYLRFLDMIAEFANKCVDLEGEPIPMIFRPFHECNGDWFWWGEKYLSDEDYVALFRYTIDYLFGECKIDNFAVAYSPNGPITDKKEYLSRYPGDDIVDILGIDYYNDAPHKGDAFCRKLQTSMDLMFQIAQVHGKLTALTETGYRALDTEEGYFEGLAPSGNTDKTWFTDLLAALLSCEGGRRCVYMLVWSNFSDTQFWLPYRKENFEHELCQDFVEFVQNPHIVMAPVLGIDSVV